MRLILSYMKNEDNPVNKPGCFRDNFRFSAGVGITRVLCVIRPRLFRLVRKFALPQKPLGNKTRKTGVNNYQQSPLFFYFYYYPNFLYELVRGRGEHAMLTRNSTS